MAKAMSAKIFFEPAFRALFFNGIDGDYVEFGCCGGMTFRGAYRQSRKCGMRIKLWAFDSFRGLPPKASSKDEHPLWTEGALSIGVDEFKKLCARNGIPSADFTVVPGFYEKSLADPSDKNLPMNICLAYIDCDLYSSTAAVLKFLMTRLKHGMIIAFDDYYCWSSAQVSGERKACSDFFKNNKDWVLVPFIRYGWHGMSFVVESRKVEGDCSTCY